MKKTMYRFLFIVLASYNLQAVEINENKKTISPYQLYYFVKEFIKMQCNILFGYISYEKLESCKICCAQCHDVINGSRVWAYLVVGTNESLVQKLMHITMHGGKDELNDFMIHACQQIALPCYSCDQQYHGWYLYKPRIE